ncbi:ATP-grasp domain-containing protein [Hydrogenimonas urashimensis]|uniref:ATP-binding protein n=1 Tax=Hydrogenimonas urashimensis TaxID=2740515 RepID=UPI001914F70A|nr:ATP-grasp domain-containing protein [Hydrogenimonas urashimensis]
MKKKILFLGASVSQLPVIKYAKKAGHYIITCDYMPENPGNALANEYYNISTIDKEAVLQLATKLKIDAIVSFASDVNIVTQSYVANRLGLPSNPYESVMTLTRKDRFRSFLKKHGFNVPRSQGFSNYKDAAAFANTINYPLIIKPTDAAGSMGVTKIDSKSELKKAFDYAMQFSREKKVILEEFIQRKGFQVGGDGFIENGKLAFKAWTNAHFNDACNPLIPIGTSFPSIHDKSKLEYAHREFQRLFDLLKLKSGAVNFEFIFDQNDNLYIIEVGPRNGGNLIPEVTHYATGVNLIECTVKAALGIQCELKKRETDKYFSYYVIHSEKNGVLQKIQFDSEIEENIVEKHLFKKEGDNVNRYENAKQQLGIVILRFSSQDEMINKMENMQQYIKIFIK